MMWELSEKGQLSEAEELPESSNLSRAWESNAASSPRCQFLLALGVGVGKGGTEGDVLV